MVTDWILMRRVAVELERALKGGRVLDAGLLEDGRFALRIGALRGRPDATLAVDAFGSPPLPTLTNDEIALAGDPGWTRAVSAALRGMRVAGVRARRGDRVLVLSFSTQSRFGVESEARLVLELIPRYGNVVLLRERTVITAAKYFSPAENEARSIQAGQPYMPPPLPQPRLAQPAFIAALAGDRAARVRAMGAYQPLVPRLIAESIVTEAEALPWPSASELAMWLERRMQTVLDSTEGEPEGLGQVHAYFEGERLVQAHVMKLAQFAQLRYDAVSHVLPLFTLARSGDAALKDFGKLERTRSALAARIQKRRDAATSELAAIEARRADAAGRESLRIAGDAIYTHAHEIEPGASSFVPATNPELTIALDPLLDPKANAQAYFARYRKAADALPHLEARRELLVARLASYEELHFELERADAAGIDDIASALDELEGKRATARPAARKPRPLLRLDRPSGARIIVGRSPRENVEVTFRLAKPDDLWFHARNIPGSHVVLQPPPGGEPDESDLATAADLAATHSRARLALRVEIDYTERKYVRKQRDGAPGLVWYTNARTLIGRPASAG